MISPTMQHTDVDFLFNLFTDAGIAIRGKRWERACRAYLALTPLQQQSLKIVVVALSYNANRFAETAKYAGRCAKIGGTKHRAGSKPVQYWLVWEVES